MKFETLRIHEDEHTITITLNRLDKQNSINFQMLHEINAVLNYVLNKPACHMIILEGQEGVFCTGMDFSDLIHVGSSVERDRIHGWAKLYMATLKRFTTIPKLIVSVVDGKVIAGGTGLVAASDIVIATSKAQFKLSEALWGLLPAMIAPFIIRRVGFQKTYSLALTAKTLTATEAESIHLVDLLDENPKAALKDLLRRMSRIDEETVHELKSYFHKLWIITEEMENMAVEKTTDLFMSAKVQSKVRSALSE